jgi:hypothetical protein
MVKIDTDVPIGEEGADVRVKKRKVGMVMTEQYGSKMLSIGGVNLLTGENGLWVARTITDIANKQAVRLEVEGGSRLELQVGHPPTIDGQKPGKMRVGCGSATLGLFASILKEGADEVIVLDSHFTGLLSEHAAGRFVGTRPSGVKLVFNQSTPGRYFGDHGKGWGGASISRPLDVISEIDGNVAWVGMKILITETTGQKAAMYELGEDRQLHEVSIPERARNALEAISSSCEPSLVSAIYMGGSGGSARAGVVRYPVRRSHLHPARWGHQFHGGCSSGQDWLLLLDTHPSHHLSYRIHHGAPGLRGDGGPRPGYEAIRCRRASESIRLAWIIHEKCG